jgi:hypothetical protein
MKATIFAGPSLCGHPILDDDSLDWQPPASEGDVYRATQSKPCLIGLIDGQFEIVPNVWHKEILWALAQGIHVYGAASIGALRAVELAPFGMIGTGAVFEAFRDGRLADDDEVAVMHAAGELGYRPLTEAMVDMRATLIAAAQTGIVSRKTAARLIAIAKCLFFKRRNWDAVLRLGGRARLPRSQLARLARWIPANRVEQKRMDAIAMVGVVRRRLVSRPGPFRPQFTFQDTGHWQHVLSRHREPETSAASKE